MRQVCEDFLTQLCMFYQIYEADTIIMEKDELKRVLETLIAHCDPRVEKAPKGATLLWQDRFGQRINTSRGALCEVRA